MTTPKQIAQTIASQIGARTLMALGATKMTAVSGGVGHFGGLLFKASLFGSQQCLVTITLNARDLYDFAVLSPRSKAVLASGTDIFCEDLSGTIEVAVEQHFANRRA